MSVELVSHDASDLKCVNAARVSYNTHHDELTEGDEKLINAMLREGHGSVFEHSTFTFRVKAPIMVLRQWHRHRAGHSYNEMSGRYVEMPNEFYYPKARTQEGKSMNYTYKGVSKKVEKQAERLLERSYDTAYAHYSVLLEMGIAKEVARCVLPQGLITQMYWTCNARSLMHFLALRTDAHAQEDIRTLAWEADKHFRDVMPVTHTAFVINGRKAP